MRQNIFGRSIVGRAMEILLIEDDLVDARAAMQVLDRGHVRCRVSLVRDGEEALAFIHRKGIFAKAPRPDLILLDVQLPKKSGCEVLTEVHDDEELKKIPVVVMSTAETCPTLLRRANALPCWNSCPSRWTPSGSWPWSNRCTTRS